MSGEKTEVVHCKHCDMPIVDCGSDGWLHDHDNEPLCNRRTLDDVREWLELPDDVVLTREMVKAVEADPKFTYAEPGYSSIINTDQSPDGAVRTAAELASLTAADGGRFRDWKATSEYRRARARWPEHQGLFDQAAHDGWLAAGGSE